MLLNIMTIVLEYQNYPLRNYIFCKQKHTWFCWDASIAFIITKAAAADGFPLQFSMVFNNDKGEFGMLMKGGLVWCSILVVCIGIQSAGTALIGRGGDDGIWSLEDESCAIGFEEAAIDSIACSFCSFSICCCVLESNENNVRKDWFKFKE